jgi:hypothetical protein
MSVASLLQVRLIGSQLSMWYFSGVLSNGVIFLGFHLNCKDDLVSSKSVISGMSMGDLKSRKKKEKKK